MNAQDQFYIFLVCVAVGAGGGIFYDFFYCLRTFFRMRWVRFAADFCFCLLFGGLYLFVSVMMGFLSLRLFPLLGCLAGLFLYLKSFHKIVAFFAEKLYNRFKRMKKDGGIWKRGHLRRQKLRGSQ